MTVILGVNAYHGDSSACLTIDGKLIAAVEEERFRRIKHWAGFPSLSIKYCLDEAGLKVENIDHVAFSRNPMANLKNKFLFTVTKRPSLTFLKSRLSVAGRMKNVSDQLVHALGENIDSFKARVHWIEHHNAHSASAFYVSPFENAAVVSIDAFGDFRSTMISSGQGNKLDTISTVEFPHSLGILYTAVTQYLGFHQYGDEYKVMGLAAAGQPNYLDEFRKMVVLESKGTFKLNLDYFLHATGRMDMTWEDCEPHISNAFSGHMVKRLGQPRDPKDPLTQKHKDIAASLQKVLEEAYFHILNHAHGLTGSKSLALAGGVAFNSVANGKIFNETPFEDVYIQSAAGDAGTALGAASYVYCSKLEMPKDFVMSTSYWGPEYNDQTVSSVLQTSNLTYEQLSEENVTKRTAEAIAEGKVIGWFQGRAEWGPRALGNRSILVDPRRAEMREVLNERIKRREQFRPFAPAILLESVGEYFCESYPDPFMSKVYPVKPNKQEVIPAVTHIDGTGRLQTVDQSQNPRFWKLIKEFENVTGVPVLLNTSFNENEPIVCSPEEAVNCFKRTRMDVLVINNFFIIKENNG